MTTAYKYVTNAKELDLKLLEVLEERQKLRDGQGVRSGVPAHDLIHTMSKFRRVQGTFDNEDLEKEFSFTRVTARLGLLEAKGLVEGVGVGRGLARRWTKLTPEILKAREEKEAQAKRFEELQDKVRKALTKHRIDTCIRHTLPGPRIEVLGEGSMRKLLQILNDV